MNLYICLYLILFFVFLLNVIKINFYYIDNFIWKNSYEMRAFSKDSSIIKKDKLDNFTNKKIMNQ